MPLKHLSEAWFIHPTSLGWADTRRALLENGDQSGQPPQRRSASLNPPVPCAPTPPVKPALCAAVARQKGRVAPCSIFGHRARSHSSAPAGGDDVPRDGGCSSNFQPSSPLLPIASRGSACPRTRLRQGWGLSGFLFVCLSGVFCFVLFGARFFERHGKICSEEIIIIKMEMEKGLKPISCG